jgi:hypothetical protein
MRFPWANTLLLLLILLQAVTGYFGFTAGRPAERWLLWLHGIGAYAILLLLFWKGAIILDVFGRGRRWTLRRLAFLFMLALLLVVLLSGLWWTFYGPHYLFGFSVISLHIYLAVALFLLVAWHTIAYRWILNRPRSRDRRAFLSTSALAVAGLAAWAVSDQAKRLLALPGALRRFTGSYERASFSPNFPTVSWINDRPAPVDLDIWRLTVDGAVARPLTFDYDQLLALAPRDLQTILDCTGGWYTEQQWRGLPLATLLEMVATDSAARSITFRSVTGYNRRFDLQRGRQILLATHVAGRPLSHGHGFPLRLVVPGERGVHWVKWLTHIQLNTSSHLLQPPLPLR